MRRFLNLLGEFAVAVAVDSMPESMTVTPETDEEAHSLVVPAEYRCDACRAAAFQIHRALDIAKPKDPSGFEEKSQFRERTVLISEALDIACAEKTYDDYGPKDVGGTRKLNGPGIEWEGIGFMRKGKKWPRRLSAVCKSFVEDVGEERLVAIWQTNGDLEAAGCQKKCGLVAAPATQEGQQRPERTKKTKKTKRQLATFEMPSAPHETHTITAPDELNDLMSMKSNAKTKFVLLLFHDDTAASHRAIAILEMAARKFHDRKSTKEREVQRIPVARSDGGGPSGTWGLPVQKLPTLVLIRRWENTPRILTADALAGPNAVVDWVRDEVLNKPLPIDPVEAAKKSEGSQPERNVDDEDQEEGETQKPKRKRKKEGGKKDGEL
eukprot:TRINITY_DN54547_c0_g1_i1.p1 TRINITY_DN54547_c0_g1~~TRINITY_DN54547_c0_g1_i1.p1  ORF type:complete len:381 (-),score=74.86 TRINITY_DN54547_c0_g1_i1:93-1235(-)